MSCSTRTIAAPPSRMRGQGRVDVADHDRREAEADLVAEQQFGVRHQRAADRDHLLLAARKRRAGAAPPLPQDREEGVDRLEVPRPGAARAWPPIRRFSSTLSEGKSLRPSGTMAMPRRSTLSAGAARRSARRGAGPCRARCAARPLIERSSVDLPAPFAPMIATHSPRLDGDVDAEERLELAVTAP